MRILIVEDDPATAEIARIALERPDRELLMAATVGEAREHLSRSTVSLVVSDLELPDGDGRELLCVLRDLPAQGTPPFLVVSGKPHLPAHPESLAQGVSEVFAKPLAPASLAGAVDAWLRRIAATSDSGTSPR